MRKLFITITPIFLFFFLTGSGMASPDLLVEFKYNGRDYSIQGKKINKFKYIFNEGAEKKIKIITLDWPPYIGKQICKQGWVQQVTIAVLASQGYEIESAFYPWARGLIEVEKGMADILYPSYYIEDASPSDVVKGTKRLDHLALSEKFPGGPVAFIKRKGEKDRFNGNLNDLKGEKIGVVRGYQNTPEFDTLMDQGHFSIYKAKNDVMNAQMLMKKRVNLIIGDPSVIRFSVMVSNELSQKKKDYILNNIEMVEPVIKYNHLYFAVSKKRPQWKATLETINRALRELEESGEISRIIKSVNEACGISSD